MLKRIASNAVANVSNGASAAVFQIGMTAMIARTGTSKDLALWSLAASIAGFAPLLSCNLSTAVARRLADPAVHANHANVVMTAARALARRLTTAGFLLALLVAALVPLLYSQLAGPSAWHAAVMCCAFFVGSCWIVAAQPDQGWLVSAHRNWPIAHAALLARASSLLVAGLPLLVWHWPVWIALVPGSLAMWLGTWAMRQRETSRCPDNLVVLEQVRLRTYLRGFAVWGLTSAAIQAATVPVVALLAPGQATPFYLAFVLVSLVLGVAMAAANALVAPMAQLLQNTSKVPALSATIKATLLLCVGVNGGLLLLFAALNPLLSVWVASTAAEASQVRYCLALLSLQQGLRSAAIAASVVLAMGSSGKTLTRAPLVEAAGVLLFAVPMAAAWGPTGLMAGLALAGALGALGVAWFASREVLAAQGARQPLLRYVAALQLGVAAVWLPLAYFGRGAA
jgi:hypothetical protein